LWVVVLGLPLAPQELGNLLKMRFDHVEQRLLGQRTQITMGFVVLGIRDHSLKNNKSIKCIQMFTMVGLGNGLHGPQKISKSESSCD